MSRIFLKSLKLLTLNQFGLKSIPSILNRNTFQNLVSGFCTKNILNDSKPKIQDRSAELKTENLPKSDLPDATPQLGKNTISSNSSLILIQPVPEKPSVETSRITSETKPIESIFQKFLHSNEQSPTIETLNKIVHPVAPTQIKHSKEESLKENITENKKINVINIVSISSDFQYDQKDMENKRISSSPLRKKDVSLIECSKSKRSDLKYARQKATDNSALVKIESNRSNSPSNNENRIIKSAKPPNKTGLHSDSINSRTENNTYVLYSVDNPTNEQSNLIDQQMLNKNNTYLNTTKIPMVSGKKNLIPIIKPTTPETNKIERNNKLQDNKQSLNPNDSTKDQVEKSKQKNNLPNSTATKYKNINFYNVSNLGNTGISRNDSLIYPCSIKESHKKTLELKRRYNLPKIAHQSKTSQGNSKKHDNTNEVQKTSLKTISSQEPKILFKHKTENNAMSSYKPEININAKQNISENVEKLSANQKSTYSNTSTNKQISQNRSLHSQNSIKISKTIILPKPAINKPEIPLSIQHPKHTKFVTKIPKKLIQSDSKNNPTLKISKLKKFYPVQTKKLNEDHKGKFSVPVDRSRVEKKLAQQNFATSAPESVQQNFSTVAQGLSQQNFSNLALGLSQQKIDNVSENSFSLRTNTIDGTRKLTPNSSIPIVNPKYKLIPPIPVPASNNRCKSAPVDRIVEARGRVGTNNILNDTRPASAGPESNRTGRLAPRSNITSKSSLPIGVATGKFLLQFTCKKCNHRNSNHITKQAYYKGVVIVRCGGCHNNHLIADNLKWFSDMGKKRNIEDIMAEKGEQVHKSVSGVVEIFDKDVK